MKQTPQSTARRAGYEVLAVDHTEIACDGGTLGHPKVYLHIERESGQVTCPYCSRTFVLK